MEAWALGAFPRQPKWNVCRRKTQRVFPLPPSASCSPSLSTLHPQTDVHLLTGPQGNPLGLPLLESTCILRLFHSPDAGKPFPPLELWRQDRSTLIIRTRSFLLKPEVYITICIYQRTQNFTAKNVNFTIRKLCLNF